MRILLLFFISPMILSAQSSAEEVLARACSYHDPHRNWPILDATLFFKETRPDGPDRQTIIEINNAQSYMKINRNDEEIYEITGQEAKVIKGDKGKERALLLRNYYLYLWGLPMKLNDEGTPEITWVSHEVVGETLCDVLRVAYEKDTWYFHFDQNSGRMLQYTFYTDEQAGKGERITVENEIIFKGLRIPQKRSWYELPEMKYLGTDILERSE